MRGGLGRSIVAAGKQAGCVGTVRMAAARVQQGMYGKGIRLAMARASASSSRVAGLRKCVAVVGATPVGVLRADDTHHHIAMCLLYEGCLLCSCADGAVVRLRLCTHTHTVSLACAVAMMQRQ